MINEDLNKESKDLLIDLENSTKQKEKAEEKKNKMFASLKRSEEKMRTELKEIQAAMESAMSRKSKEVARERETIANLESRIVQLE